MANSARRRFGRWLRSLGPCKFGVDSSQAQILGAIAAGNHLKGHRYLDGTKTYRLHNPQGAVIAAVDGADVTALEARGLLASNMKFPVSVYLLTQAGAKLVDALSAQQAQSLAEDAASANLSWQE